MKRYYFLLITFICALAFHSYAGTPNIQLSVDTGNPNILYMAASNMGVYRVDVATVTKTKLTSGLPNDAIPTSIVTAEQQVILGTTKGLYRLNAQDAWEPLGLPGQNVYSLFARRDGSELFASTDEGVCYQPQNDGWICNDLSKGKVKNYDVKFAESPRGDIYAVNNKVGLYVLKTPQASWTLLSSLGVSWLPTIHAISVSKDGVLYLATGTGLFQYVQAKNGSKMKFKHIGGRHILLSMITDPRKNNVIYEGSYNSGLLYSEHYGEKVQFIISNTNKVNAIVDAGDFVYFISKVNKKQYALFAIAAGWYISDTGPALLTFPVEK